MRAVLLIAFWIAILFGAVWLDDYFQAETAKPRPEIVVIEGPPNYRQVSHPERPAGEYGESPGIETASSEAFEMSLIAGVLASLVERGKTEKALETAEACKTSDFGKDSLRLTMMNAYVRIKMPAALQGVDYHRNLAGRYLQLKYYSGRTLGEAFAIATSDLPALALNARVGHWIWVNVPDQWVVEAQELKRIFAEEEANHMAAGRKIADAMRDGFLKAEALRTLAGLQSNVNSNAADEMLVQAAEQVKDRQMSPPKKSNEQGGKETLSSFFVSLFKGYPRFVTALLLIGIYSFPKLAKDPLEQGSKRITAGIGWLRDRFVSLFKKPAEPAAPLIVQHRVAVDSPEADAAERQVSMAPQPLPGTKPDGQGAP
jgi:hypothetical protein